MDRGKPHPNHSEWAEYLKWAAQKSSIDVIQQRVIGVDLAYDGSFKVGSLIKGERADTLYDGVVFTGPGKPLKVGERGHDWIPTKILDGQDFWTNLHLFRELSDGRVAIIGAGETAASIAVALINEAPRLNIEIINRSGTLYTRGESYHENELYTNAAKWAQLDEIDRRDFIRRTDRGVFSVEAKKTIDHADNIRTITGTVIGLERRGQVVEVELERLNNRRQYNYDIVVVAIGFDPFWPLDLLDEGLRIHFPTSNRAERRKASRKIQGLVDYHFRLPVPFDPEKSNGYRNFHVPMLSAMSQGPGFPNLSCLGSLSDRILSAYVKDDEEIGDDD